MFFFIHVLNAHFVNLATGRPSIITMKTQEVVWWYLEVSGIVAVVVFIVKQPPLAMKIYLMWQKSGSQTSFITFLSDDDESFSLEVLATGTQMTHLEKTF